MNLLSPCLLPNIKLIISLFEIFIQILIKYFKTSKKD